MEILGHKFVIIDEEFGEPTYYICEICKIEAVTMNGKILKPLGGASVSRPLTITCNEQIIKNILE